MEKRRVKESKGLRARMAGAATTVEDVEIGGNSKCVGTNFKIANINELLVNLRL